MYRLGYFGFFSPTNPLNPPIPLTFRLKDKRTQTYGYCEVLLYGTPQMARQRKQQQTHASPQPITEHSVPELGQMLTSKYLIPFWWVHQMLT